MERATRQNTAIRAVFTRARRPLTPVEVLQEARRDVAGLGLATVYRAIKGLRDEGLIQAVSLPGDPPRYEACAGGHHHHFRCDGCGRVFDVARCPGGLGSLAPAGFSVLRHDITLYGLCRDCRPAPRRPRAPAKDAR